MTLTTRPWYDLWALRLLAVALLLLLPLMAISAPACIPGLYGDTFPGTTAYYGRFDRGWYAWGFCKGQVTGAPVPVYRLCAHGECANDMAASAGRTMAGLGAQLVGQPPQAVYGTWWDANPPAFHCEADGGAQVTSPGSARGQACAELLGLIRSTTPAWAAPPTPTPVPTPPPVQWRVKRNPQSTTVPTTRPVYPLVGGVLGTKALSKRAIEGEPCDTSRPTLTSGADLWASYGTSPVAGEVALCVKVAP